MDSKQFLTKVKQLRDDGVLFVVDPDEAEISPSPIDLVYQRATGDIDFDTEQGIAWRLGLLGLGPDDRDALVEASLLHEQDCEIPAMRRRLLEACNCDEVEYTD